ncbi:hypothetical protein N7466_005562 [Penicillium verhagenii]|uniref:uncharacterized protein n=1 Tax=Penicillium verhagenii TaxID=1562060 RepID=UPI0025454262|nr:uncharacterized protein N7466_005562 [Penicillium verhagenii]KAJ5930069.1 hypothetical protein N7466_005562 [Penicillium verhagenii]
MQDPIKQSPAEYEADRQAREVYRYFQPTNPAALNAAWLPLGDDSASVAGLSATTSTAPDLPVPGTTAVEAPSVLSSPNTTLTSFAQLAAQHLNAQRAFITILNRDAQFIIAEATKTTHIGEPGLLVGEQGRLFAGTSTLQSPWNVCQVKSLIRSIISSIKSHYELTSFLAQETVATSPDTQDGKYPLLVINDLALEERFKNLPFVDGEPHSRFYAGTPLTTDRNINVGCLFVLDPHPRDGLSEVQKDALGTVAAMVMDYMHISRQAVEGRRASRLSQGLHLFVDGHSSFPSSVHMSRSNSVSSHSSSRRSSYFRTSRSTSSRKCGSEPHAEVDGADSPIRETRSLSRDSNTNPDGAISPKAATPLRALQQAGSDSSISSSSNDWIFQRAANLLRQGLELNGESGVMFLKNSNHLTDQISDGHSCPTDANKSAPVLSISTRDDPLSFQTESTPSCPAVNLDKEFLTQLAHNYPRGRLWSFHSDGSLSISDEDEYTGTSQRVKDKYRASETSKLNTYFPEACQIMFVPLWNAIESQWFAGCFCWTPQPTKIFSRAVDLSSVFGFASSIMTEYSRVESVIADRQKGDFISSISHELRSPLHGVLAAAEFLGDTSVDEFQESLIETINACGRTLLDTMNQVLDFSKIMSLQRRKRRHKRRKDPSKPKVTDEISARMDLFVTTDVATLTEDVVDSVCLGHFHMKRSTTSNNPPITDFPLSNFNPTKEDNKASSYSEVDVVVDISNNDWSYKVQPGSLRRLIMNLLGNALKYTDKGLISVCVEATQLPKGRSQHQASEDVVTLTVSDTGRGISGEYLRTRLYTPFSQENPLSVGTGLGLSIVRGIVDTLNGNINIQSRVGEGTIVKVSFPLQRPEGERNPFSKTCADSPALDALTASSKLRDMNLTGKRAAIWGMGSSAIAHHQFWSSVARYATDWYGLKVVPWSAEERIDVLFADESDLSSENLQHLPAGLPNLLVFYDNRSSPGESREEWSHLAGSVALLRRPCGPHRLARGILSCLDSKADSLMKRSHSLRQGFVISERPRLASALSENSTFKSFEELNVPATESLELIPGTQRHGLHVAQRDDTALGLDTKPPGRDTSNIHPSSSVPHSTGSLADADLPSVNASRPRVLLVDDNDINLRLLVTHMKKRNVTIVHTAHNGRAAVNCVESMPQGYDLIFMDISMPIMNGFEATRAIRMIEKERGSAVPAKIIAFTGLSSPRSESESVDSGMDLFLTKPVSFKDVSRLVNDWRTKSSDSC